MTQAWFTLMAEAMQGTQEAQRAFQSLSEMSPSSEEEVKRWLAQFMPASSATAAPQPEAFEAWLEEWWRVMGVVPRSRYLELLEKCDTLQRRLEKAEQTIKGLQATLGSQGPHSEEAQKVVDLWSTMLEETLKTQSEWMRAWTAAHEPPETAADADSAAADAEGAADADPEDEQQTTA